jgi:UDP-GlcNAc:undecaprenyl-phosphate/decaprenyl-phosphate GlcNAc-1-phosphate transferase
MIIDWIYIFTFSVGAVVVLLATPLVQMAALKHEQFDMPSVRKVHQRPTARLGGVAIFGATVFAVFGLWAMGDMTATQGFDEAALSMVALLLLGGSGFFSIGFADDLFSLSALNRLWMQGAIAGAIWIGGVRIESLMLPGLEGPLGLGALSLPVTVLWLVGVVNAINWIDGLDGLAAGVSGIAALVIVSIAMAVGQPVPALLGSALSGSLLGFLYYNYSPAKIFMGDGGSYFIGFVLASLCIVGPMQIESGFASLLPLVILAVPLGDMTSVIVARLYCRCSPFCADNRHFHHRLLRAFTHQKAVWVLYVLTLVTGAVAWVLVGVANSWTLWGAIALLLLLLITNLRRAFHLSPSVQSSDIVAKEELWYSKNL